MNILTLILIIFFYHEVNAETLSNKLQWCQNETDHKILNCYFEKEFTNLFVKKNKKCLQEIFVIDEEKKQIIFDDKIHQFDVKIDCLKDHVYSFVFSSEKVNRRKEILKGSGGIDNC